MRTLRSKGAENLRVSGRAGVSNDRWNGAAEPPVDTGQMKRN